MGQRHQLFVIAKIGNRYRGLAVVHHQWLYGVYALKVCYQLVRTFQAEENRLALEHEIRWAGTLEEEDWHADGEAIVPFPFIHTCLVTCASFNPDEDRYQSVIDEPFNMDFDGGDNNDGITIIDISDLSRVRYCFTIFSGLFEDEKAQIMAPLYATDYFRQYYKEGERKYQDFLEDTRKFEGLELIEVSALKSAWPDGEWEENWALERAQSEGMEPSRLQTTLLATSQCSTLKAASLTKLLDELFSSPLVDLPTIIESASKLPDFWSAVKSKLYNKPDMVSESPVGGYLLSLALESESTIDLSPFKISANQLREVLLTGKIDIERVTTLNLSGNQDIKQDLLREILALFKNLKTLHLLNTPQIPLETKIEVVKGTTVTELLATELLAQPFIGPAKSEIPLTYLAPPIIQMITINCAEHDHPHKRFSDNGINLEHLLAKADYYNFSISQSLENVNRPPPSFLLGLTKFMKYFTSWHYNYYGIMMRNRNHEAEQIIAFCLATAEICSESSNEQEKPFRVGTLCDTLYRRSDSEPKPRPIKIGEWTLVFVLDRGCQGGNSYDTTRYAFITLGAGKDNNQAAGDATMPEVVIADFETFLRQIFTGDKACEIQRRLLEGWNKYADGWKQPNQRRNIKLCGREEIESYLRSTDFIYNDVSCGSAKGQEAQEPAA